MRHLYSLLLLCVLFSAGCQPAETTRAPEPKTAPAKPAAPVRFDAARAFEHLKKQVAFGPRVPGTKAHAETLAYLERELRKHCDRVEVQRFNHRYTGRLVERLRGKTLPMANVIGFINPEAKTQLILCAHWDTRPVADVDIEIANRQKPIDGANDGASGVAILLELARVFKEKRPDVGLIIVFFDGEDLAEWPEHMLLGSKYFVKNLPNPKPQRGILLDLVGDKDLVLTREFYSISADKKTYDRLFEIGHSLGYGKHFPLDTQAQAVGDDHLPLIENNIPTVNLIDFNYVHWHTLQDTVDKCSPESLKVIGSVVETYVYEQK